MRGFLARVLITAFGLWLADMLLPGIRFDGAGPLFGAAILLGVVNAFVRPIVVLLTIPITLVTLGLFMLVINGGMLALVAWIMPAFHVAGLGAAIIASVIVGITSWAANSYIGDKGSIQAVSVKGKKS